MQIQPDHHFNSSYQQVQGQRALSSGLMQQATSVCYEFSSVSGQSNEPAQYQNQAEFEQTNLVCVPTYDCQLSDGQKQSQNEYSSLERLSLSCEPQFAADRGQDAPVSTGAQAGAQLKGERLLKGRRGRPRKKGLRSKSK